MNNLFTCRVQYIDDRDPFDISTFPTPVRAKSFTFITNQVLREQLPALHTLLQAPLQLEDCTLQLCKLPNFGPYLDIDLCLDDQRKQVDEYYNGHKCSFLLRTQLQVRVKLLIERLQSAAQSDLRELRRSLFSLKELFERDQDLIHEFVTNRGLQSLIQLGNLVDQINFQTYILRAITQMIVYVDGMNGLINNNDVVQWMYSILDVTQRKLISKNTLKVLLVFVNYNESNAILFVDAVHYVDRHEGKTPFYRLIVQLSQPDMDQLETVELSMALINRTLSALPDQDTFYDVTDSLEMQGMQKIAQNLLEQLRGMADNKNAVKIVEQVRNYEAALQYEDNGACADNSLQIPKDRVKSTTPRQSARRRRIAADTTSMIDLSSMGRSSGKISPSPLTKRLSSIINTTTPPPQQQQPTTTTETTTSSDRWKKSAKPAGFSNLHSRWEAASGSAVVQKPKKKSEEVLPAKAAAEVIVSRKITIPGSTIQPSKQPRVGIQKVDVQVGSCLSAGIVNRAKQSLDSQQQQRSSIPSNYQRASNLFTPSGRPATITEANLPSLDQTVVALNVCNIDFDKLLAEDTDQDDDEDDVVKQNGQISSGLIPPPPPPPPGAIPPPPPPPPSIPPPPPPFLHSSQTSLAVSSTSPSSPCPSESGFSGGSSKTIRLHWKPNPRHPPKCIWSEIGRVQVNADQIRKQFELKQTDMKFKKTSENRKEIIVLDTKRSNAINIGLTGLPPIDQIKSAILAMNDPAFKKEHIEKLISMIPTSDEIYRINEARHEFRDIPLGRAEEFLLTLSTIDELGARLHLWLFRNDFDGSLREIVEPLNDLLIGMKEVRRCETFRRALAVILAVGNVLNGTDVAGFQLDYLSKVSEVRGADKNSLLYLVTTIVDKQFSIRSNIYSEIGSIVRCSKVDFEDLEARLKKLESDCDTALQHLLTIKQVTGGESNKSTRVFGPPSTVAADPSRTFQRLENYLTDCKRQIRIAQRVRQVITAKFKRFGRWLGMDDDGSKMTSVQRTCKLIAEFALEYRTSREKLDQIEEKKRMLHERAQNRGKLIVDRRAGGGSKAIRADLNGSLTDGNITDNSQSINEFLLARQLAKGTTDSRTLSSSDTRRFRQPIPARFGGHRRCGGASGAETDTAGDTITTTGDDILDSLVRTAAVPDQQPTRLRKSTKLGDRKSFRRKHAAQLASSDDPRTRPLYGDYPMRF